MKAPQTKPPSVSDLAELKKHVPDGDVYKVTFSDGSWEIRIEYQGKLVGWFKQREGVLKVRPTLEKELAECKRWGVECVELGFLQHVQTELERQRAAGRKHMARKSMIDWSTVNWNNTDSAIARHLGRTQPCVAYQRVKANKPPAPRGTRKETYNPNK